ncbi:MULTISPECIES: hypothetical protein [Natrinema]|uniref:Uncharacterized protein n=1 Tax=Natrinema gari JCM 14663 TaxID=1230459 RepID=L9ZDL9_9EURY|nr:MULTISPECIES: hypothetical protein [Natrinema]AFO56356.1 hypothetical protein NJ7G_1109 [Natrinema sp. J7-2]ELY83273.1 hypothetical protein C486_02873 [Natrinema gari JCM 14663]
MKLSELPIVEEVFESGANDRVFDSLLLIGPVLIVGIAIVGRSLLTTGIAIAYVLFFVAYVVYLGISN